MDAQDGESDGFTWQLQEVQGDAEDLADASCALLRHLPERFDFHHGRESGLPEGRCHQSEQAPTGRITPMKCIGETLLYAFFNLFCKIR